MSERCVLFNLADRADSQTTKCWPGMDLMAEELGVDRTYVQRLIKRLEKKGAIICIRTPGAKNNYFLRMKGVDNSLQVDRSPRADNSPQDNGLHEGRTIVPGGGGQESTTPADNSLPEQSINREENKERTEGDFSSFPSSNGDKGGEAVHDERPRMAALFHDLAASLPQSKPGATRHSTAGASSNGPAKEPVKTPPPSPFRKRLSELMAKGMPYLEAYNQVEKEGL